MDIATLIGLIAGFTLIIVSIMLGSPLSTFINPPSVIIVFGGTICCALIAENMGNCINAAKVAFNAFLNKSPSVENTISVIAKLAAVVRKEGLLALENEQIDDPFLAKGVRFAVDGIPPDEIQTSLKAELVALKQRHKRGQQLFRFMASTAPAMGMIGTLIGLVQMLRTLDDPSSIGPSMAVALLTTLYGALIAFLLCGPIAEKLEHRSSEEVANMIVVIEGLDSILKGENGRIVQEKLAGYLPPKDRNLEAA